MVKEWTGPNLAGCAYYDSDRARIASPYISRTQRSESRTVGGSINNNEIRPSTSLREMNFHFMALLGKRTMQGQFHKPAERLGAIATSRAKVAERLSRSKLCGEPSETSETRTMLTGEVSAGTRKRVGPRWPCAADLRD